MTDLISRLSEKLDEAERLALAATDGPWRDLPMGSDGAKVLAGGQTFRTARRPAWCGEFADAAHIALWDPESVLRLVAAHRKIIERHAPVRRMGWGSDEPGWYGRIDPACATCGSGDLGLPHPCDTLKILAAGWGVTEGEG